MGKRKPKKQSGRRALDHAECDARIAELDAMLQAAAKEARKLLDRVAELERQVGQDSTNSNRPPSTDPPSRPPRKKRSNGERKPGGQPGRKGTTRSLLPPEQVDEIRDHKPRSCGNCGSGLRGADPEPLRHQVADLPEVRPVVVEHRLHALTCTRCSTTTRGELPQDVPKRAFGPRVVAVLTLLTGGYRISKRNAQQLLRDCFGLEISVGSIKALEADTSRVLRPRVEEALTHVQSGGQATHMDETSWRDRGRRVWLWTMVTAEIAVFRIRPSRGGEVAREMLGDSCAGPLIADRYSGYAWYPPDLRQFCWSHLIRDFKKLAECPGRLGEIGAKLLDERCKLFRWWRRVRDGTLSRRDFQELVTPLRAEVEDLLAEAGACPGGPSKLVGMARKIHEHRVCMWTFVEVEGVEPTNNAAEQALRHAVIWRKTSFGTQSRGGSDYVESMLSTVTTLRLQGRNVLEFLCQASHAALTGDPPPSLLPICATQKSVAA